MMLPPNMDFVPPWRHVADGFRNGLCLAIRPQAGRLWQIRAARELVCRRIGNS